jgi:hypothetical protein
MRPDYSEWLASQEYAANTQAAQLHRVQRVEQFYGNLDDLLKEERINELLSALEYSVHDERVGKPNPSKIPFEGNVRNNLQSYKNAVSRYVKFVSGVEPAIVAIVPSKSSPTLAVSDDESSLEKQRLSLERDMQAALRRDISHLEAGLRVIDDGAERAVTSGFIDILCEDQFGVTVVVELKAGKTDARVVGQVLGYMGDIIAEDDNANVRGIVVAHEFDRRTASAAKAVPNLKLIRYSIRFEFEAVL